MKKKSKLLMVFSVVLALFVGFFIGISVDYPKFDKGSVAGTITKINNYRNSQNSTSEIKLQNELTSDTVKLKSVQKLLNFYYLTAVNMDMNVQFTIKEANAIDDFKKANQTQISNLINYEKFLSSARTDLLLAISVCQKPEGTNPLLLKELLNQANNIIAQISYRNRTVLEFIDVLSTYLEKNKTGNSQELIKARDILTLNEINLAVKTGDKQLLKNFDYKVFLKDEKNLASIGNNNLTNLVQQDMEKLACDLEKLDAWDAEQLGFNDSEQLGSTLFWDAEKLGGIEINDAEQLGFLLNDAEQLGGGFWDAEQLGGSLVNDAEQLGGLFIN